MLRPDFRLRSRRVMVSNPFSRFSANTASRIRIMFFTATFSFFTEITPLFSWMMSRQMFSTLGAIRLLNSWKASIRYFSQILTFFLFHYSPSNFNFSRNFT